MDNPSYKQFTELINDLGETLRSQEVRNDDELNQIIGTLQVTLHLLFTYKQHVKEESQYTSDPHDESISACIRKANNLTWELLITLQPYTIDNYTIEDNIDKATSYLAKIMPVYKNLKKLEE